MEEVKTADRREKQCYWEDHLSQWQASRLSQSAYCRKHELSLHRFRYWKKKRRLPNHPRVSMVEVPLSRQDAACLFGASPPLCIIFGTRCRIEIREGFDPATLETVLRLLARL
jgi:hypothetical protein